MSGLEEAKRLLVIAGKDLLALKNMKDVGAFPEEVFGFHAQQAVEKTLKSWIAAFGASYDFKHDLRSLLIKLEELHCNVDDLWEFVDLNAFAVQYRYMGFDIADAPLDREDMISKVQALYDKVSKITGERLD